MAVAGLFTVVVFAGLSLWCQRGVLVARHIIWSDDVDARQWEEYTYYYNLMWSVWFYFRQLCA